MLSKSLLLASFCALISADVVHRKLCPDVDSSQCAVHSVDVDPCPHGPKFCTFVKNKLYNINVNFTPYFSAHNMKVAVSSDLQDIGTFSPMRTYKDACRSLLTCPLEAHVRQSIDIPIAMDKRVLFKFPVQVKLWNEEDESQACCFTFRAKVK